MSLSNPSVIFGIHSISAYDPDTRLPLGIAKVVGTGNMNLSGEVIELNGGSSRYPWANEDGVISPELSITLKEYPPFLIEAFLGKAPTETAAEAGGSVSSSLENANGVSALDASTGIATATVKSGSEADLKTGFYVVKVVSSTTVDVFSLTDVDFAQGTDKEFEDDDLKITASALTITASTAVEIPDFGVELTGGSGTIGMTIGDTAVFEVRAINDGSEETVIGSSTESYGEVGIVIAAQKRSTGELFMIDCYRAKGIGMPIGFTEKEFSEAEITMKLRQDTSRNGVFKIRMNKASS